MVTNVKAFPNMTNQTGMDLRDYFAAKAMQAMIQNSALLEDKSSSVFNVFETYDFEHAIVCGVNAEIDLEDGNRGTKYTWAQYYAEEAYCIADAMIKARETKPDEHQTQSAPTSRQPSDPSSW